jgi:hypothetical protein
MTTVFRTTRLSVYAVFELKGQSKTGKMLEVEITKDEKCLEQLCDNSIAVNIKQHPRACGQHAEATDFHTAAPRICRKLTGKMPSEGLSLHLATRATDIGSDGSKISVLRDEVHRPIGQQNLGATGMEGVDFIVIGAIDGAPSATAVQI